VKNNKDLTQKIEEVRSLVLELFEGDAILAEDWMNAELPILGCKSPIEYIISTSDSTDIVKIINRIRNEGFP